jgi:hypothetical protein
MEKVLESDTEFYEETGTMALPENIPASMQWLPERRCYAKDYEDLQPTMPQFFESSENDTSVIKNALDIPPTNMYNLVFAHLNIVRSNLTNNSKKLLWVLLKDWSIAFSNNELTRPLLPSTVAIMGTMRESYGVSVSPSLMKKRNLLPLTSFNVPSGGLLVWSNTDKTNEE